MITPKEMRAIGRAMADAEMVIVERDIDRAAFEQGLQIMRDLHALRANKIFLAGSGRCLPQSGGSTNPNAECYDQVHRYPKGRWS